MVALGREPSRILAERGIAHLLVPHPSPRNRTLNENHDEWIWVERLGEYIGAGAWGP